MGEGRKNPKSSENESRNPENKSKDTQAAAKRRRLEGGGAEKKEMRLFEKVAQSRKDVAESVKDFDFNKKRVLYLTDREEVADEGKAILYWMLRDHRVYDNWSLLFAQKLALKKKLPLAVVFCFHELCDGPEATLRTFNFMVKGLKEVAADCRKKNIHFEVLKGVPAKVIPKYVKTKKIGAVVTDFFPLRDPTEWTSDVAVKLPNDVPLAIVDSHNVVPAWIMHDKQVYQARQMRINFVKLFPEFLTNFPDVISHPHKFPGAKKKEIDWKTFMENADINREVKDVEGVKGGPKAAMKALEEFIEEDLEDCDDYKNDPAKDCAPNLSHYFHFGHLSSHRAFLEVRKVDKRRDYESMCVNPFYEEVVVRKEMNDNFCLYNDQYDKLEGALDWAIETLKAHRRDEREYQYDEEQLENAETHDELFNAATIQLKTEGRMHRYMKMYWPKKILEWTQNPQKAIDIANRLFNRYAYDGRDPESYLAVMWAICGVHDRAWAERDIYGKVRHMTYEGCRKKFSVDAYVERYSG